MGSPGWLCPGEEKGRPGAMDSDPRRPVCQSGGICFNGFSLRDKISAHHRSRPPIPPAPECTSPPPGPDRTSAPSAPFLPEALPHCPAEGTPSVNLFQPDRPQFAFKRLHRPNKVALWDHLLTTCGPWPMRDPGGDGRAGSGSQPLRCSPPSSPVFFALSSVSEGGLGSSGIPTARAPAQAQKAAMTHSA